MCKIAAPSRTHGGSCQHTIPLTCTLACWGWACQGQAAGHMTASTDCLERTSTGTSSTPVTTKWPNCYTAGCMHGAMQEMLQCDVHVWPAGSLRQGCISLMSMMRVQGMCYGGLTQLVATETCTVQVGCQCTPALPHSPIFTEWNQA